MPIGMSKNVTVTGKGSKLFFRQRILGLIENEGTIYYALDEDGDSVKVHWLNTTGTNELTVSTGGTIHLFLIGGGGGGGHAGRGANTSSNHYVWSGGGGGGGVLEIESYSVPANQTLTFEIGAGGTAGVDGYRGNNGGDTTFNGLTAYGGGGGGGARTNNFSGNNGGAGGGASTYGCCVTSVSGGQNGGSGVSGQGYGGGLATGNNGYGGGGGGAGSSGNANNVATNKGLGGSARVIYTRSFGGGGGAGAEGGSIGQVGGVNAGRGAASRSPGGNGTNGVDGYGGGGGGGSFYNGGNGFLPGKGGNGGVVVAYKYSGEIPYPPWEENTNRSEWYGISSRKDLESGYSWNGSSTTRANTPGNTTDIVHHLAPGVYHNGNYYAPPYRSGTSITKYNISSNTFSTISISGYSIGSSAYGFWGSVLGPNGKIYFIPWDAANVVVLDTSNDSISTISGSPGGACCKWGGGVLANNGLIYTAPGNRNRVGRINTSNNTFAESTVTNAGTGESWYRAGVLAPSGIIYFFPRTATNILKYNPSSLDWSTFGSSMFTSCSLGAWQSKTSCAFLAPNGKIYAFGSVTTSGCKRILRLDPTDDSLTEISSDYAFGRGCMAPDGKVYFLRSTDFLVFDTETETVSLNSYTNNPTTDLFPFVADDGNIYGVPGIGGSPVLRLNENGKKNISGDFVYSRYNKSSL